MVEYRMAGRRRRMKVHISPGNRKMGAIPSVSLPPLVTCIDNPPCKRDCYALGVYYRPNVRVCWDDNYERLLSTEDPDQYCDYFSDIHQWGKLHKPEFFRWHVGGDIQDQNYLDWMCAVAGELPDTNFATWTKRFSLDFSKIPANLHIWASMWPGWGVPSKVKHLPRFWLKNDHEDRIPEDAIKCPDNCIQCKICYTVTEPIDVCVKGKGQWVNRRWQKEVADETNK